MGAPTALDQRIDRWRKDLLDMSLRNRLLNFKSSSAVAVVRPPATFLFDRLAVRERTLTVREAPPEDGGIGVDEVGAADTPRGLEWDLRRLRLKARGYLQEQGINILFLTFGMVRWYEAPDSNDELFSPLVLVPVELVRDGPLEPFRVRMVDEDVVVNPNLDYRLSVDFGIRLPSWGTESTLPDVLEAARRALAPAERWSVDDRVYLGLFTFAKLAMYKETVSERPRMSAHPFLNALAGDPSLLPVVPDAPTADELDARVRPLDMYQVVDADSSQQEAIEMAKRGMSFVLQGPPGTGKSQTITNIIAEMLAAERKVLFVSEKMAALEVVEKRLEGRGLGDYVLELHSRKSDKSAIMDEIRRSLAPLPVERASTDDLLRLERVRDELNRYATALHEPRGGSGCSAYQMHGRLARLLGAPDLPLAVPDALVMTAADLDDRLRLARRVEAHRGQIEGMDAHPWKDLRPIDLVASDEVIIGSSLKEHSVAILQFQKSMDKLVTTAGLPPAATMDEARRSLELASRAIASPLPEAPWMVPGRPQALIEEADRLEGMYSKRNYDLRWLASRYDEGVMGLDLQVMSGRMEADNKGPFRFLDPRYRADMAALRRWRRGQQRMTYDEAVEDLRRLVLVNDHARRLAAAEAVGAKDLGARFKGQDTDWTTLRKDLQWTNQYLEDLGVTPSPRLVGVVSGTARPGEMGEALKEAQTREAGAAKALESLDRLFVTPYLDRPGDLPVDVTLLLIDDHLRGLSSLREWLELTSLERSCREGGVGELFDLGRKGGLPPGDLVAAYEKRACRVWMDQAYAGESMLRDFRGEAQEETVALFRRLDQRQMEVARQRLLGLLNARREMLLGAVATKNSEMTILRHEAGKKKRFKHLRQLFQECPNAILSLKPCLLMSPLSVSTFLDPSKVSFDVVIFDEASQVRPEDAIGSIMRAKQVIVVGDSRQLPPTDFFRSGADEDEEDVMDLESILDECAALSIRQPMLLWHYRSRDEALIAFSNRHFYDGRLFTFPSAGHATGDWGVSFIHVPDGVYDRAGTRTNRVEAVKVAETVMEHFRSSPERTLGVVAFSEPQQMAIIEELEALRKDEPELEHHFMEDNLEGFFVKNLENVQGDERDVMIFSVGYGRDEQGRMVQNFGPLNKAGGERRLNVAITRARMHVKLVSSMLPEDIEGSGSQGGKLLKEYLAYAASGGYDETVPAKVEPSVHHPDSIIEDEVFRVLSAEGLKLERRVGCSGYRIDMAVEDPDRPGAYLLGIECDGVSYRSARTARDRDRIRGEVLKGLGWRLHRIWSKDWVTDRDREVAKVLKAVELSREAPTSTVPPAEGNERVVAGKASFAPALRELVRTQGPVHMEVARRAMEGHVDHPRDVDQVLSHHLHALSGEGSVAVKDGFIWPAGMKVPPVRLPPGGGPMELDYVSLEEIGEAELYNMGADSVITRTALLDRTAMFYRHRNLSEKARRRLSEALDRLVAEGRLTILGGERLSRAR